jgi:hypothetical protein
LGHCNKDASWSGSCRFDTLDLSILYLAAVLLDKFGIFNVMEGEGEAVC